MSMTNHKMFYVSWEAFHRASRELAAKLLTGRFERILAVSRGGLVPATILARELNIRLLDTICIVSYQHDQQGELSVVKGCDWPDDAKLLIVDDLVDTGETAKVLKQQFPQATLATVYAKPQGKPLVDVYVTDIEQDTWIQLPWDTELSYTAPLVEQHS
ncbi:xanthine phosphoribosyltransferase [Alkalimonas sp. NCh-2]|uniref:xanthine phosphoribosyltransferase n=1 Tax=Alkalimonas sp. NCh-2 TaxID=3144846 RepID=UPI0031F69894